MERWTVADQEQLDAMLKRKQILHDQHRNRIVNMAVRSLSGVSMPLKEQIADWMIRNADELRDALQPFDSGVRPAPEPAPWPLDPQPPEQSAYALMPSPFVSI